MAITFNQTPSSLLVPFVGAEFDNSQATSGPSLLAYRLLIIGQRMTGQGTATANTLYQLTGSKADQAGLLCGRRSMAFSMVKAAEAVNAFTDMYLLVLDDNAAGTQAAGSFAFAGTTVAAGGSTTVHCYVGLDYIPVAVAVGDTPAQVATKVSAALNAYDGIPFTFAVSTATVTATHNNKGECGNGHPLGLNVSLGQALPTGISCTVTQPTSGATNPTLTSAIAALGDEWFHVWANPFTDTTSLSAIEAELASRAGPLRMIDGYAVASARGSASTIGTLGSARNSQFSSIVAPPLPLPMVPTYEFAAGAAAALAFEGANDPARPLQTVPIGRNIPGSLLTRFTQTERNTLLTQGVATSTIDNDGLPRFDRLVSTYKTNAAGAPDASYRDATTSLTLAYCRYDWRNRIRTKYPRHKLTSSGARIAAGQAIMDELTMKSEALAWFNDMVGLGLFEESSRAQFKRDLQVVRSTANRTRLDVLLPPDLINQLITTAAVIQFRL